MYGLQETDLVVKYYDEAFGISRESNVAIVLVIGRQLSAILTTLFHCRQLHYLLHLQCQPINSISGRATLSKTSRFLFMFIALELYEQHEEFSSND